MSAFAQKDSNRDAGMRALIDELSGVSGDPGRAIEEILREYPDIWLQLVPDGVCLVLRHQLKKLVGDDRARHMESLGVDCCHHVQVENFNRRNERMSLEQEE